MTKVRTPSERTVYAAHLRTRRGGWRSFFHDRVQTLLTLWLPLTRERSAGFVSQRESDLHLGQRWQSRVCQVLRYVVPNAEGAGCAREEAARQDEERERASRRCVHCVGELTVEADLTHV